MSFSGLLYFSSSFECTDENCFSRPSRIQWTFSWKILVAKMWCNSFLITLCTPIIRSSTPNKQIYCVFTRWNKYRYFFPLRSRCHKLESVLSAVGRGGGVRNEKRSEKAPIFTPPPVHPSSNSQENIIFHGGKRVFSSSTISILIIFNFLFFIFHIYVRVSLSHPLHMYVYSHHILFSFDTSKIERKCFHMLILIVGALLYSLLFFFFVLFWATKWKV